MAPWRGLEPPIYRLGGGCVIHYATRASIGRGGERRLTTIVANYFDAVKKLWHFFYTLGSILFWIAFLGGGQMCQNEKTDLDDLIFDENDGGPSER